MSIPIPSSQPRAKLAAVMAAAQAAWKSHEPLPDFFVLAVRAYYRDSMGLAGENDVGQYDDAFFIVSPLGFSAWNGNTDPSRYGWNPNADKFMARLKPGCWKMIYRMHRGSYWAFGQGEHPVTVERMRKDGSVERQETGCFGIDLHKGGVNGTSSEGCLTVPLAQWNDFVNRLRGTMNRLDASTFDLILVDGPIN